VVQRRICFPANSAGGIHLDTASDIRDFIAETPMFPRAHRHVSHSGAIATWALSIDSYAKSSVSNTPSLVRQGDCHRT